jgi:hypothetical protein
MDKMLILNCYLFMQNITILAALYNVYFCTLNDLAMCFPNFPNPRTPIFTPFSIVGSCICSFIQSIFVCKSTRLLFSLSSTCRITLSLINLTKFGYANRQIGTFERLDVSFSLLNNGSLYTRVP